jgi:hypothetical protein
MNDKYQYKQGQRIFYNLDGKIKGWATICGAATEELPTIGRSWIIKPERPLPFDKKIYPFSCITAFSCQIKDKEFEFTPKEFEFTPSAEPVPEQSTEKS